MSIVDTYAGARDVVLEHQVKSAEETMAARTWVQKATSDIQADLWGRQMEQQKRMFDEQLKMQQMQKLVKTGTSMAIGAATGGASLTFGDLMKNYFKDQAAASVPFDNIEQAKEDFKFNRDDWTSVEDLGWGK